MADHAFHLIQPDDIRRILAAEAAYEADETKRAFDAAREAQIADEQKTAADADAKAAAAAADYAEMDPPEYATLALDGLLPARANMVRYNRWRESLEHEIQQLTAGRTAYLTAQGVPALTKASIAKLIDDDHSGLISLMSNAGAGISKHQLRSHEKKLLQEKLSRDEHAATVASQALEAVDAKLDALSVQLEVVQSRRDEFLAAALEEHIAMTAGARLLAAVEEVRAAELTLLGAAAAVQQLRNISYRQMDQRCVFPTPRAIRVPGVRGYAGAGMVLSGTADQPTPIDHSVEWPVFEQIQMQRRMAELAKKLAADPTAQLDAN